MRVGFESPRSMARRRSVFGERTVSVSSLAMMLKVLRCRAGPSRSWWWRCRRRPRVSVVKAAEFGGRLHVLALQQVPKSLSNEADELAKAASRLLEQERMIAVAARGRCEGGGWEVTQVKPEVQFPPTSFLQRPAAAASGSQITQDMHEDARRAVRMLRCECGELQRCCCHGEGVVVVKEGGRTWRGLSEFLPRLRGGPCPPTTPQAARSAHRPIARLRGVKRTTAYSSRCQIAMAGNVRRVRGSEGKRGAKNRLPRAVAPAFRSYMEDHSCHTSTMVYRLPCGPYP